MMMSAANGREFTSPGRLTGLMGPLEVENEPA